MPVKSSDPTLIIPRQPSAGEREAAPPVPMADDAPAPPEPLDAPWLRTVAWVVPTLLMAALGVIRAGTPGLWEDELATWGMVSTPWADFWQILRNVDATIGPYYLLVRLWAEVAGTSDLMLRLPSVLAMAGAAGLLAALGTRLGGLRVGVAAGTLFAVIPMTSRYAQEARPYALTILAAVLCTFLLVRLLDRSTFPRYAAYALSVVLLGLSHVVALLLLGAHALIVWKMRSHTRGVLGWFGATALALLPVLPVFYLGRQQTQDQIGWIPEVDVRRVAETPESLFGGPFVAGAVMALALLAMSMKKPALVATLWALVPVAGLLAVSQVTPMWITRYLLFVLPAWVLLGSLALRRVSVLRGLGAVLAIGLLALPVQLEIRQPIGHQQGTKDVGSVLRTHSRLGDAIVYGGFADGDQRTSRDTVLRYVPASRRPVDVLLTRAPRTNGRLGGEECLDREVPACLGRPDRVWVVRKGALDNPLTGMGPAKEVLLRTNYVTAQSWRVKGFTIALLTRKPEK